MNPYIVGYTRDSKGKIQNYHLKNVANTIHTSSGAGGNTCQYILEPQILRQERTEEEKHRRHLHGDSGAKFSSSKVLRPRTDGMSNTISTATKDNLLLVHMRDGSTKHARVRKLTPTECFRLQGVSDADIDKIQKAGISKTQQYKQAGNSITCDVLYYIFDKMFVNTNPTLVPGTQLSIF